MVSEVRLVVGMPGNANHEYALSLRYDLISCYWGYRLQNIYHFVLNVNIFRMNFTF